MKNQYSSFTGEDFEQHAEIIRIGNIAVRKAQEENHRYGLPNIYYKNGRMYYQYPDGEITDVKRRESEN